MTKVLIFKSMSLAYLPALLPEMISAMPASASVAA